MVGSGHIPAHHKMQGVQSRRLRPVTNPGVHRHEIYGHMRIHQRRTQLFRIVNNSSRGSGVDLSDNEVQTTSTPPTSNGHIDLPGMDEELASLNVVHRMDHTGDNGGAGAKTQQGMQGGLWNGEATSMITLLTVAMLWGTYVPSLKYLLSLPGPPAPSVLMAVKSVMATGLLQIGVLISRRWGGKDAKSLENKPADIKPKQMFMKIQTKGIKQNMQRILTWSSASLLICGSELGLWNFLASSAQAIGLQYTSATRTAFLIQSTALFTPLVALAAGKLI